MATYPDEVKAQGSPPAYDGSTPLLNASGRWERFCHEYLVDLNATAAYRRAGYKSAGEAAKSNASRLITNDNVAARINYLRSQRAERLELNSDYVLSGFVAIHERCIEGKPKMRFDRAEQEWVRVEDDDGNEVWEFDATNANRALENIGKHLGMFGSDGRSTNPHHHKHDHAVDFDALTDEQLERIAKGEPLARVTHIEPEQG